MKRTGIIFFITMFIPILMSCERNELYSLANEKSADTNTAIIGSTAISLPTVTTNAITGDLAYTVYVAGTSAKGAGNVTSQGSSTVTARGLCWDITNNPTTGSFTMANGAGTGSFEVTMTGLTVDTVYYVRAYATSSDGTSYGPEISFNSGKAYGTTYQGGLVFYNDGNGGGMVSADDTTEMSGAECKWGSYSTLISGTGTAVGTGQANTTAIVAWLISNLSDTWGDYTNKTSRAAYQCDSLTVSVYTDWFLPSKDELNLMYNNLKLNSFGNFAAADYWSSSEFDAGYAYFRSFAVENQGNTGKASATLKARAVRAF